MSRNRYNTSLFITLIEDEIVCCSPSWTLFSPIFKNKTYKLQNGLFIFFQKNKLIVSETKPENLKSFYTLQENEVLVFPEQFKNNKSLKPLRNIAFAIPLKFLRGKPTSDIYHLTSKSTLNMWLKTLTTQ